MPVRHSYDSMSALQKDAARPLEIGRANEHDVKIRWNDGTEVVYPARFLRLECPCAVCVDELTGRRIVLPATISDDVHPAAIERVGHYAIQIYWSDGHNSGIYTWEHLRALSKRIPQAG